MTNNDSPWNTDLESQAPIMCGRNKWSPPPGLIDREVVESAHLVEKWMKEQGHKEWELCGVCDREFAYKAQRLEIERDKEKRKVDLLIQTINRELKPTASASMVIKLAQNLRNI